MILSGPEIQKRIEAGQIVITPFSKENINPNSYNLTLDKKLLTYNNEVLDCRSPNPHTEIEIPEEGYVLQPGQLYLANTAEWTETYNLVPVLYGRSSLGRLGLFVHITAGFGDDGFKGKWTLELMVVKPLRIYAGMKICQIIYQGLEGENLPYAGKYQDSKDVKASEYYKD